jgi:hypothetical protein
MSPSPESFFLTVLHAVECHIGISKQGLTQWFPSDLFGHQTKDAQKVRHHFDNQFDHRSSKSGDIGISLDAVHELFDQLEQVSNCVVACTDVSCRLEYLDDTTIRK